MKTFKIRYLYSQRTGCYPVIDLDNQLDIDEFLVNGFREVFEEELTFCLVRQNQIMYTVNTLAKALALCSSDSSLKIAIPYFPKSMNSVEVAKSDLNKNKNQVDPSDLIAF